MAENWQEAFEQGHAEAKEAVDKLFQSPEMLRANLGLASNEEMLRELICRFKTTQYIPGSRETFSQNYDRALVLAEMLGGMDAPTKEYRTADG